MQQTKEKWRKTNKGRRFFNIAPTLGGTKLNFNKNNTIINRVRLGAPVFSYNNTKCDNCGAEPLTLDHIIQTCPAHHVTRTKLQAMCQQNNTPFTTSNVIHPKANGTIAKLTKAILKESKVPF